MSFKTEQQSHSSKCYAITIMDNVQKHY